MAPRTARLHKRTCRPAPVAAPVKTVTPERVRHDPVVLNTVTQAVTRTVVVPDEALVAALRQETVDLRRLLAEKTAEIEALKQTPAEPARQPREDRRRDWREREAKLKEEDPERYAAVQKQREEFRGRMAQAVSDKVKFLMELDASAMTPEEKAGHDELVRRIEESWTVVEQIQEAGFPDAEARAKLRENFGRIGELYDAERDYVLRQVGADLGYDEADASQFSAYMQRVYELTTPRPPRGAMGGRSRPPTAPEGGN